MLIYLHIGGNIMAKVKLGIAFAGGGVRGAGHLGIMQALYENKIYPEIYAGTSAGSIVASCLAYGYNPEKALEKFESINKEMIDIAYAHILKGIFTKSHIEGLVAGDKLEELLNELFEGKNISAIRSSHLGIVATDIDRGKQVILSNKAGDHNKINDDNFEWFSALDVPLSEIVRASCGMPPIFIPKYISNMKLVDGGITNNLPSDVAVALGAEKVISIDLGYAGEVQTKGIIDIAHESINIMMSRVVDGNRNDFGLYLNPKIYDVSSLQIDRIQECYERGYKYGISQIDAIVKYLEEA
jgi:NTE family protein